MTSRPRDHGDGNGDNPDPPDGGAPPPRPPDEGDDPGNIRAAEQATLVKIRRGHAEARDVGTAAPTSAQDQLLATVMRTYDQLGPKPPWVDLGRNDFENKSAHVVAHHGPDVPLRRDPGVRTIEGRIYKDEGWGREENQSFRWDTWEVMTEEINRYIRRHWDTIRSDLAMTGSHRNGYDSHHRVGEGFLNNGMFGTGPREARYMVTSLVRIRIRLVENADPAKAFVVTAFPAGLLP